MKYAVEIYTYIPIFIEIGSDIQKLIEGGICRHTDSIEIA
jgi:hypothetical protein